MESKGKNLYIDICQLHINKYRYFFRYAMKGGHLIFTYLFTVMPSNIFCVLIMFLGWCLTSEGVFPSSKYGKLSFQDSGRIHEWLTNIYFNFLGICFHFIQIILYINMNLILLDCLHLCFWHFTLISNGCHTFYGFLLFCSDDR